MKTNKPFVGACLVTLLSLLTLSAEETAVVKENRVNVRGQPTLASEVVTQLQQGDKVVVLDQVPVAKPQTNEPSQWARIQMPHDGSVWVFAPFLAADSTVRVTRLNLRGGPGENYSIVGRIDRGTPVKELKRSGQWVQIEPPAGAYAFVASELLSKPEGQPANPAPSLAPPPTNPLAPAATIAQTQTPPPDLTAVPDEKSTPPPVATKQDQKEPIQVMLPPPPDLASAPTNSAETKPEPVKPREAKPVLPPVNLNVPEGPNKAATAPKAPVEHIRRIVRREGIVRSTTSIQAPTYYELLSPENHRTINYLHTDKLDVKLEDYRGRLIVVTGEEAIDPRWPRTPVLEVETLKLIP